MKRRIHPGAPCFLTGDGGTTGLTKHRHVRTKAIGDNKPRQGPQRAGKHIWNSKEPAGVKEVFRQTKKSPVKKSTSKRSSGKFFARPAVFAAY